MFNELSNHIKESIDHIDGYLTGRLIVERDKEAVAFSQMTYLFHLQTLITSKLETMTHSTP